MDSVGITSSWSLASESTLEGRRRMFKGWETDVDVKLSSKQLNSFIKEYEISVKSVVVKLFEFPLGVIRVFRGICED